MSHQRIIKMTHNDDVYKLAIVADYDEMSYSLAVIQMTHTHSSMHFHTIATFYNIHDATREYHNRVGHETNETLKTLYEQHSQDFLF